MKDLLKPLPLISITVLVFLLITSCYGTGVWMAEQVATYKAAQGANQ